MGEESTVRLDEDGRLFITTAFLGEDAEGRTQFMYGSRMARRVSE